MTKNPHSNNQIKSGLLISVVTMILCFGLLELIGYVWETKTAQGPLGWTLVGARRLKLEKYGSTEQPYYKLKPFEDYNWEEIPVSINYLGFRNEEFSVQKPKDTFRILNLGDSVAFGWEVRVENTYGKKLEHYLNESSDGIQYEVINVGIPTWNLEAERNFLLDEGLEYQPDLIILDITIVNDIYGKNKAVSEDRSLFQWLRDHTYGWPFLTTNVRFLLAKQMGPEAFPVLNPPKEASGYYPLDENDETWDRVWKLIEEMYRASQANDADFVMLIFPTAYQVNSADHPDIPQRVLVDRAKQIDVKCIDLLPVYKMVCKDANPVKCEGYENLLFADVWMHPNVLGHQLAYEALISTIEDGK
jgi:hypothetical protein